MFHPAYFLTRFYVSSEELNFPDRGVILSACATTGETWSADRNRVADRELESCLRDYSFGFLIRLIGYSPVDNHAEASWLIDLDLESGCRIGLRFLQDALYLLDHESLDVVDCSDRFRRAAVGNFYDRLDRLEPEAMRKRLESY